MPRQPRCGSDASTRTHARNKAVNQVGDVPSQALQTRGAQRILIAGIGNIFFGDDAFGCEVAAELAKRSWPDGVTVVDFGIRAYDLAYAVMDGYDATVLIDAAPRNEKPGTVYLLELNPDKLETGAEEIADAHALTPVRVLQLIRALGGRAENLYLIGCEPARLDAEGVIGLSDEVRNAVPIAVKMIESIVCDLAGGRRLQENFPNLPTGDVRFIEDEV
jgi:hydrogenase maturation protease